MTTTSKTDWDRLNKLTDDEIDYTDIPPLTHEFFARARLELPNAVELEADILAWFKGQDRDYTRRINDILREYIEVRERAA